MKQRPAPLLALVLVAGITVLPPLPGSSATRLGRLAGTTAAVAGAAEAPEPITAGAGGSAGPAPACSPARGYHPPVSAPVTDPFRAPEHPFGPGNRGLEYATAPGTAVRAIGAGTVVFAGQVAGELHVTVRHGDGLRSTSSYLAAVEVRTGQAVARGQVLGQAGDRLHLGVRCGTAYVDPAPLFEGRRRARLVPDARFPRPPPAAAG